MSKWDWWNFSTWRPLYRNLIISAAIVWMSVISTKPFTTFFSLIVIWLVVILTITLSKSIQEKLNKAKLNIERKESEKTFLNEDEQQRLKDLERMFQEENNEDKGLK